MCSEARMSSTGSYAFAHSSRQHAELVAILGDRAPRDLHTAFLQDVDDSLVCERMLRILLRHQLFDLGLDSPRGHILATGRREARGEEELQRQHAAWRLDELLVRHA